MLSDFLTEERGIIQFILIQKEFNLGAFVLEVD